MKLEYIVVSDLDGTLLDHHTYAWNAAQQALDLLKLRHIPLILCSSKTAAEMLPLRQALDNHDPFITENGAAVYLPAPGSDDNNYERIEFGMNRADILSILEKIKRSAEGKKFCFTGFSDMSLSELMAATGLDEESAGKAMQREFGEPLQWQGTEEDLKEFQQILNRLGLDTLQGGRFLHVSAGCDKGKAVNWMKNYYHEKTGLYCQVIALGDSENDISMLEIAEFPVLIKSPVKAFPALSHEHVLRTTGYGPVGWNEALLELLNQKQGTQ
jgi:mannosyl-3-phosphoglycerate phosphatase